MNFCIVQTMRRLWSPRHELSCSWLLWRRLTIALRARGRNRTRESGAFLLGRQEDGRKRIVDFILYDDVDPECLESGIVRFDGRFFGAVWARCAQLHLSVVADIHVHPGRSDQSESDRRHPIIARAGHLALILPNFAAAPVRRDGIGIYRYQGSKRWSIVPFRSRREFLYIGL